MSDTPRTDAYLASRPNDGQSWADFARQLERELGTVSSRECGRNCVGIGTCRRHYIEAQPIDSVMPEGKE